MSAANPPVVPDPKQPPKANGGGPPAPDPSAQELSAAKAELAKLRAQIGEGGLAAFLERAGGDAVAVGVQNYLRVKADPRFAKAIEHLEQTGELPKGAADSVEPEDEYLTPEARKIQQLETQLAQIRSGQDELTASTGQAALEGHFRRFLGEHPLKPAEVEALRKEMRTTFGDWAKAGDMGRQALRSLQHPEAYDKVRRLLVGALPEPVLLDLGARKASLRKERRDELATDEPPTRMGDEAIPEFKGANAALRAFEWSEAHPEKNPHRFRY